MSAARSRLRRRLARPLIAVVASALAALALAAPSAWATATHPGPANVFGPDGTPATSFNSLGSVAINQANRHLFALNGGEGVMDGWQINSPTSRTPLPPPFPFTAAGSYFPGLVASKGNIFYFGAGIANRGLYGVNETTGQPINARYPAFPPGPEGEGYACGVAQDGQGNVWLAVEEHPWNLNTMLVEYSPTGEELTQVRLSEEFGRTLCTIAIDPATDDLYVSEEGQYGTHGTFRLTAASEYQNGVEISPHTARVITVDAATGNAYLATKVEENGQIKNKVIVIAPSGAVLEEFGAGEQYPEITGLAVDESDETVYVSRGEHIEAFPPGPIIADATTGEVASATPSSVVVTGHVDPAGGGPITKCEFEYGETTAYKSGTAPCDQATPIAGAGEVTATLPNLIAGRRYHFRIRVENASGPTKGADQILSVAGAPTVDALFSSNLTASSVELNAQINPQGVPTTYQFEYGTTAQYGSAIPLAPGAVPGTGLKDKRVSEVLGGIASGTYHFRVVATNQFGTTDSPDQTFNYYPPECPNAHLRQQTGSSYLPDCRAYELVSPGNAGGAVMFPETAPSAPFATNPARLPFAAGLGVIPGTKPANGTGVDTYVATRTDTGWETHLGGLRGYEVLGNSVIWGDSSFDKTLDFREPDDFGGTPQPPHFLPYIWDYKNNFLERWPAGFESLPDSETNHGAYQPSADFSHLAFSSNNLAWSKGGVQESPGSAYDYDTKTHSISLISVMPNGEPIGSTSSEPKPYEFIFFPGNTIGYTGYPPTPYQGAPSRELGSGVSDDGSHILMATAGGLFPEYGGHLTENIVLYMRVNDETTYLVSKGHKVNYIGMTSDGTKVFFTSKEQLTAEDTDNSLDLYMWSQATDSLKLLSASPTGGNGSSCESDWAPTCGIEVVHGEDESDNSYAYGNGDVYFFSPELLAGPNHGSPGQRNLYVFRNGAPQYVTTLEDQSRLSISRIQVSPDDSHAAFITKSRIGAYENNNFAEMYSYEPPTGKLVCVSCLPSGEVPSSNVEGSLDGIFMSNDGRTFFYTADALVPRDTDKIHDVYEYTEGQAQLITTGTAAQDRTQKANPRAGGLAGISADGVNVYFVTYETLVPEDENGDFQKYYDARVDGGFPYTPPPAACEAADECHGEGSNPPAPGQIVSENSLGGGGNVAPVKKHAKKKHKKKHHKKKHHKTKHKKNAKGSAKKKAKNRARTGGKGR
jgi:hypothetical protein